MIWNAIGITKQQIIFWEAPPDLWIGKLRRKKKTWCGLIFLTVVYVSLNIFSQEDSVEECEGKHTKMCVPANVLVLDTPTCKIGLPKLWPPEFKSTWRDWLSDSDKKKAPMCNQELKLFYYVKPDHVINVTYRDFQNCFIREVIRDPAAKNDNYYLEVNQIDLTTSRIVDVAHIEMFEVVCNKYYNFEANLHVKPNVKEKLDFWRKRKLKIKRKVKSAVNKQHVNVTGTGNTENVTTHDDFEERPINVLWLGLDTTSAIHVQRSFPKTLKVLKEMGFIDFPGFHSLGLMTVTNFVAYFLGTSWGMLYKNGCDRINEGAWDSCPFIWKEFEKRNYVSMFIEDDEGAFNYLKEEDGFIKSPVDYYLHPLFLAHKERRDNMSLPRAKRDCMSTETVPQYLLRYTERFLQKFNSTPFFSFTWFNYPFHDLSFSLQNVDEDFEKFYKKLAREPALLENTLLILNGDHGERYGVYQRKSIDAILEKSLPPLYIRIPEKLLRKYPHLRLKTFAESNRHRLVTGFDIHHTLLHVLSLSDELANLTQYLEEKQNKSKTKLKSTDSNTTTRTTVLQEFKPVLQDRSSLFSLIPDNRTCDTVHIENRMCVCNTHKATKLVTNPFEISRMITHTVEHINSFIGHGTGYEKYCKVWNYAYFPLISADVLEKVGNSSLVHLMFKTDPVARFEIKLRVTMSGTIGGLSTIESAAEPVRISSYGNTTWCIPAVPEKVKRMKEFCSCKKNAPKWNVENSKMKH